MAVTVLVPMLALAATPSGPKRSEENAESRTDRVSFFGTEVVVVGPKSSLSAVPTLVTAAATDVVF